jgi:enamine deaminase RidA (YjgF/YER057c/UK114 family)
MAANLRFLNPSTMSKPPGYTHVVEATGPNRLIYIAGQLGLDSDNKIVGVPGDFHAQATQAFNNLKSALAAVSADLKDVVKINNYLVDMSPCGKKLKLQERRAVIPSRRSLAACRPLGFLGRLRAPSRIGGHTRGTYGVGTYPGLHHWDGGP